MKKTLILLLAFLPLTLIGQELKCCNSEKEIEIFLSGDWKKNDSDLNRLYRFEFNNGTGKFKVFVINEDGTLKLVEENLPDIKILKTKKGFEIALNFDGLKTYSGIKFLDSTKLIITRLDGAESEYYKIAD